MKYESMAKFPQMVGERSEWCSFHNPKVFDTEKDREIAELKAKLAQNKK